MPVVREPSQRSKAWVKWNYGQNSNASKTSLNSSCTEIIHLGGSRVGSPEPYHRPGTSLSSRSGPTPEPGPRPDHGLRPDSGVRPNAGLDDELSDQDRPITGWFETAYSGARRSPVDQQLQQGVARSRTALVPASSPMNAYAPTATRSPVERDSTGSRVTQFSPAPLNVPLEKVPSPLSSHSMRSANTHSPTMSASTNGSGSGSDSLQRQLRRTQSAADIQQRVRVKSKALPPRPVEDESFDSSSDSPVSEVRHVGQLLREDAAEDRITQWFPLPPLTAPPPSKPLPPVHSGGRSESRNGGASSPTSQSEYGGASVEHAVTAVRASAVPYNKASSSSLAAARRQQRHPPPPPPPQHKLTVPAPSYSPQERLWLHRNYRGEATFLKAWGLSIDNADEREQGVTLLRELMASEEDRRQCKKAQKAKELGLPDGGLQIIIEEEKASLSEPDRPSPRMVGGAVATHVYDRVGPQKRLRVPSRAHPSPTERHLRSESESSVLGAYLDIRMSRTD